MMALETGGKSSLVHIWWVVVFVYCIYIVYNGDTIITEYDATCSIDDHSLQYKQNVRPFTNYETENCYKQKAEP